MIKQMEKPRQDHKIVQSKKIQLNVRVDSNVIADLSKLLNGVDVCSWSDAVAQAARIAARSKEPKK